jgi:hypothetical protein
MFQLLALALTSLVAFALGSVLTPSLKTTPIPTQTILEQRTKNLHKPVTIGPAKPEFPKIKLSKKKSHQKEAVAELGTNLPTIATWYDLSASQLEKELLSDSTLWVEDTGQLLYIDEIPDLLNTTETTGESITTMTGGGASIPDTGIFPDEQTFLLHSSPNSKKIIYLDFDGLSPTYSAFDLDGNPFSFNTEELQYIQKVWQMVVEDFMPFDVDVTTEAPTQDRLIRSSSTDEYYGVWALITPTNPPAGIGGLATFGAFFQIKNEATYTVSAKVWSTWYTDPVTGLPRPGVMPASSVAVILSHELGHTFGFMHKGTTAGLVYYPGHGTWNSITSWSPIMGAHARYLQQWSKGEYPDAYTDPYYGMADEVRSLASQLGYYPDDVGNDITNAKLLTINDSSVSAYGVIEQATDVDVYSFDTQGGGVSITASPAPYGPNLDIKMELRDSQGNVIATDDNQSALSVTISKTLTAGTYYILIDGVGKTATETDPGYSDYASLGQYRISGKINITINQNPVAIINFSPQTGVTPLMVNFSANQSYDPDGVISNYSWNFGDGTVGTGMGISHTYMNPGTFSPQLTVTDSGNQQNSSSANITIGQPLVIKAPYKMTIGERNKVITVKWIDNSNNEDGFYIERAVGVVSGEIPVYQRVGEVTVNARQFVETVTTNTYLYRVQAFNRTTGQVSNYSNIVSKKVR